MWVLSFILFAAYWHDVTSLLLFLLATGSLWVLSFVHPVLCLLTLLTLSLLTRMWVPTFCLYCLPLNSLLRRLCLSGSQCHFLFIPLLSANFSSAVSLFTRKWVPLFVPVFCLLTYLCISGSECCSLFVLLLFAVCCLLPADLSFSVCHCGQFVSALLCLSHLVLPHMVSAHHTRWWVLHLVCLIHHLLIIPSPLTSLSVLPLFIYSACWHLSHVSVSQNVSAISCLSCFST